jgi:metal-dependent hydrolase (beta-lactamase superfamily II)
MIRFNIIGFQKNDPDPPRWGDCTIINNNLIIDGYGGIGTTRLLERLKKLRVKTPILFISHAHYDHYNGIRKIINDSYFTPQALYMYDPDSLDASASSDVRYEINKMKTIMDEAKKTNPSLNAVWYENNAAAKASVMNHLEKSDTVLIKGSHSMNLSEMTSFLKEIC